MPKEMLTSNNNEKASKSIHLKGEGGTCKVKGSVGNKMSHCHVVQEKALCVQLCPKLTIG